MIPLILICFQAADAFGDPLPEGALARLGTIRWRHGGYVQSVAFSPDGRHALSAAENVALWDIKSGLRVRSFEGKAPVAFLDERRGISALPDGTLTLWEIPSGRRLRDYTGAKGWIGSIAVDRRGRVLLAGGQDQSVRVWDVETGVCLDTRAAQSPVSSVAVSPDGRLAASSTWKEPAVLWEIATGKILPLSEDPESRIRSIVFTPDGQRLVAGYYSGAIELREVPSDKLVYRLPQGPGRCEDAAISADGKLALSAFSDNTLNLWEVQTGATVRTFRGHRYSVFSADFSPDARLAVSGAGDGTVGLWDVATGRRLNVYDTHESEVLSGEFTIGGRHALSASHDQTLSLWDWKTGKRLKTFGPTQGTAWSLALGPEGKSVYVANGVSLLKWDLESGQSVAFKADAGAVYSVKTSPDGKSLLCSGNRLHLLDAVTGREMGSFQKANTVGAVAFCPDGRHVLAAQGKSVGRWNIERGEVVSSLQGLPSDVISVALSPDGRLAVSGTTEGSAALWDLKAPTALRIFSAHPNQISSMAFSPDGSTFATGSYDHTVALWDVNSGKRLEEFRGHLGPVYSVAFSRSGAEILSTSGDTSALVWRPSMRFRERARALALKGAPAGLESANFDEWCLAREACRILGESAVEPLLEAYPPQSTSLPPDKAMTELAERLENDSPEVRRKARRELEILGRRALPWIGQRLGALPSAELRSALEDARDSIQEFAFQAGDRGRVRAVLLLLDLSPAARSQEALKKYAAGPSDSYAAELARRALVPE